jgi:hypothetical protein
MAESGDWVWRVDECSVYFERMRLRGWCVHFRESIQSVDIRFEGSSERFRLCSYGTASPDVAAAVHPPATHVRFDEWLTPPIPLLGEPFELIATLSSGEELVGKDALTNCAHGDAYFQSWENFIASLGTFERGTVLEVGSRARSAITRRHRIPAQLGYVGTDLLAGPNVDVVGDAHELHRLFPDRRFVAVFSTSVFEHLAMPWKVVLELNHVLEMGGLVYTASHQTWPMHEEPWDFWRFSRYCWQTLFNPATGFEIVETAVGEPARVHARRTSPGTKHVPDSMAFLGSACLARKISATTLSWPVPTSVAAHAMYPEGELVVPPTRDRA